jgi:hypothetical protein
MRGTGALPDDPSADRGEPLDRLVAVARAELPSAASLREHVEIADQGTENSCVGHALGQCLRVRSRVQGSPIDPSPKAIYAIARQLAAPGARRLDDRGSHPEKAFLGLSDFGVPARSRWPDSIAVHSTLTIQELLAASVAYVTGEYTIGEDRRGEVMRAIAAGHPCFWVRAVDRSYQFWRGGLYTGLASAAIGLHAGAIVEYDADGFVDAGSYGVGHGAGGLTHHAWRFLESSDVRQIKVITSAPLEVR